MITAPFKLEVNGVRFEVLLGPHGPQLLVSAFDSTSGHHGAMRLNLTESGAIGRAIEQIARLTGHGDYLPGSTEPPAATAGIRGPDGAPFFPAGIMRTDRPSAVELPSHCGHPACEVFDRGGDVDEALAFIRGGALREHGELSSPVGVSGSADESHDSPSVETPAVLEHGEQVEDTVGARPDTAAGTPSRAVSGLEIHVEHFHAAAESSAAEIAAAIVKRVRRALL